MSGHAGACPANPINCNEHMNDDYGHAARCTLSYCVCGYDDTNYTKETPMSDNVAAQGHYPECFAANPATPDAACICPALRACEARVRGDERVVVLSGEPFVKAYAKGRAAGLDAARDVIRELEMPMPNVPMPLTYLAGLQAGRRRIAALRATP